MQQDMLRIQTRSSRHHVDGSAGGGVVSATVTGQQELVSVTIDPSAVDPADVEMLQTSWSPRSTTPYVRRASGQAEWTP